MAALNFPSSPTNGQKYTANGITYYWDSSVGAWLTWIVSRPLDTSLNTQLIFNDAGFSNGSNAMVYSKTSNTAHFGNMSVSGNVYFSNTTAIRVPVGNTTQRPTGVSGMIRFNSLTGKFEGYGASAWGTIGGGAQGGSTDDVFFENSQNVTTSYTITTGKNAMSAGPIFIDSGAIVTVPANSVWTIV